MVVSCKMLIIITISPDHLLLDSAPNLGPLIFRWKINKFENCWYESVRILEVLKLLFQQFLKLSSSQRDMSGPILGALSKNRWSWGRSEISSSPWGAPWTHNADPWTLWQCRRRSCSRVDRWSCASTRPSWPSSSCRPRGSSRPNGASPPRPSPPSSADGKPSSDRPARPGETSLLPAGAGCGSTRFS